MGGGGDGGGVCGVGGGSCSGEGVWVPNQRLLAVVGWGGGVWLGALPFFWGGGGVGWEDGAVGVLVGFGVFLGGGPVGSRCQEGGPLGSRCGGGPHVSLALGRLWAHGDL